MAPMSVRRLYLNSTHTGGGGGVIVFFLITLTLVIASSWNVTFPKIYLGRFWWSPVSQHPVLLIYRLQDSIGCNINPSYYQNTVILIQYLPSRLFLFYSYILSFLNVGISKKLKIETPFNIQEGLLDFDDVIKKVISKALSWVSL